MLFPISTSQEAEEHQALGQGLLHHVLCIKATPGTLRVSTSCPWSPSPWAGQILMWLQPEGIIQGRKKCVLTFHVVCSPPAAAGGDGVSVHEPAPMTDALHLCLPLFCPKQPLSKAPKTTTPVAKIANRVPINKQRELKPEEQTKNTFTQVTSLSSTSGFKHNFALLWYYIILLACNVTTLATRFTLCLLGRRR